MPLHPAKPVASEACLELNGVMVSMGSCPLGSQHTIKFSLSLLCSQHQFCANPSGDEMELILRVKSNENGFTTAFGESARLLQKR